MPPLRNICQRNSSATCSASYPSADQDLHGLKHVAASPFSCPANRDLRDCYRKEQFTGGIRGEIISDAKKTNPEIIFRQRGGDK